MRGKCKILLLTAAAAALLTVCSGEIDPPAGNPMTAAAVKAASLPVTIVQISVKPGGGEDPAVINLKSKGALPVAVLGRDGFDAAAVDPYTVLFAGTGVIIKKNGRAQASVEDVNGDGFPDLILHFATESLLLTAGSAKAQLTGETYDGGPIEGSAALKIAGGGPPPPIAPVLWNKLGSIFEAENSETGPNGTIIGNVNFNRDVQFGKGVTPNSGYAGSGVDFPTTLVDPEKGCVEMWTQFYYVPQWYSYGVYGLINANHWSANIMNLSWYNGNAYGHSGFLFFDLVFNGTGSSIAYRVFDPPLNVPVHIAAVWDRSGIDGSGDYMRLYVDGTMIAYNSTQNTWGADNTAGTFRAAVPWDGSFATDRYSIDNLKVWNYAKTDFSDRFTE